MAGNAGKGRPKGARNKRTVELIEKAVASGYQDPVDFLLSIVADTKADMSLRIDAAKAAAPYVRAKLTAMVPTEAPRPAERLVAPSVDGDPDLPDFVRPTTD